MLRDQSGAVHPRNEAEVAAVIRHAVAAGVTVRVRGSAHSVPGAIYSDRTMGLGTRDDVEIVLDEMIEVTFDEGRRQVTAQGGCRFAFDPRDPTGRSTLRSGLLPMLEARGWALPNLGGVAHQTVAGFLATGSAGGSATRSLDRAVIALRLIDGSGDVHALSAESNPDVFCAAGVSLGLLGIVTAVTFQCEAAYDVEGDELIAPRSQAPLSIFDDSLTDALKQTPYCRILWWPQEGVDKLVLWRARPVEPQASARVPYVALPHVFGSPTPTVFAAGAAMTVLDTWDQGLHKALGERIGRTATSAARAVGVSRLKRYAIGAFVPTSKRGQATRFRDSWSNALPMDAAIDERALPTGFTEAWLPLEHAPEAARRVRQLYARDGAGNFCCEIYAGAPSPFWLSPGFERPSVRFNFFWHERRAEDPRETFFPRFWDAFRDLGMRLHWGKHLPDGQAWAPHWAKVYPRLSDFLALRERFDPHRVLCSTYWRSQLGLSSESARVPLRRAAPLDPPPPAGAMALPVVYPFEPSTRDLLHRASRSFEVSGLVPASPTATWHAVDTMADYAQFIPLFEGALRRTQPGMSGGPVIDELFRGITVRIRVTERVPGAVWGASVEGASAPLARTMYERWTFEPEQRGTRLTIRIAYEPVAELRRLTPMLEPVFRAWFNGMIVGLARFARVKGLREEEQPRSSQASSA